MNSATIKLFLVHGDPKRLRTAEISNWTGKAVAGPRSELDGMVARDEAVATGIYLLSGSDPKTGEPAVYIGEAESVRVRLKSHLAKDFWNHATFVISKDDNLTKAHVRYLEGRLIEEAQSAGRAVVMNGQASGSKLPESDREDMEIFLRRVLQLLPVLGTDALIPATGSPEGRSEQELLTCEIKGLKASGRLAPAGLVVVAGSQAVLKERASTKNYPYVLGLRKGLIEKGVLKAKGDHLIFEEDVEFNSPSAAASVIHGGSANGLIAWKDARGRSLKEMEADPS